MSKSTFDIFLSYKSEDSGWVSNLKDDLQKRGVQVWLDKNEIRPGDLFAQALEDGLESSSAIGLVITPESVSSGWVKEEYYRALSLAKSQSLQLIPLILKDAQLPGFLSSRHHVDFRQQANFDRAVDQLVWPGLTGEKVIFSSIHGVGGFAWPALKQVISERGFSTFGPDYVEAALDEVPQLSSRGRVVVIVDLFEDWPWSTMSFREPALYADTVLKLRERTKGTPDEIIFVLYQHRDALTDAGSSLDPAIVQRFLHFFILPKDFDDRGHCKNPTLEQMTSLQEHFKGVWYRVQRQLMAAKRLT
ncbi:toll/interleukin-1 receptor domain-containing protein [Rhizobium leguminosarum]|uniref:toll/interleukin-1 receptor domain-containing protein n=1 Tax=Rhizobium leguminosarum TaxID=384 RepID=UPI0014413670|nr:toll/interleukin-1 receptor domain-containing protein [Rhizobium leguminosarum]NKL98673.1 TIR domain-containing protein [Rhizobium leguminosarum bv. viciae]